MCDALKNKEEEGKNYLRLLNMYADIELKEEKFLWDRELCKELVYLAIEAHRREARGKLIELGDKIGLGGKKLYDLAVAVEKD